MDSIREPLMKWTAEAVKLPNKIREKTSGYLEQVNTKVDEVKEFLESGQVITTMQGWCANNFPPQIACQVIVELEKQRFILQKQQELFQEVIFGDTGKGGTLKQADEHLSSSVRSGGTKIFNKLNELHELHEQSSVLNAVNHGNYQSNEKKAERRERLRALIDTQPPKIRGTRSEPERAQ